MEKVLEFAKAILLPLLILWFIVINLFVLIPSWRLLSDNNVDGADMKVLTPLSPPQAPSIIDINAKLDSQSRAVAVKITEQKVAIYSHSVNAYVQYINAYKVYTETKKARQGLTVYQTVVKDTLSALLSSVLLSFLGFVGIKATGTLLTNFLNSKNGSNLSNFKLF